MRQPNAGKDERARAATDLPGGHVQVMFGTMPASIDFVRVGSLKSRQCPGQLRAVAARNEQTKGQACLLDLLTFVADTVDDAVAVVTEQQ
jgi:hypothetical protein